MTLTKFLIGGASVMLLASPIGSCSKPDTERPPPVKTPLGRLSTTSVGLRECPETPPAGKIVIRIFLRQSVDDIFEPKSKDYRSIFYNKLPEATSEMYDNDFNPLSAGNKRNDSKDDTVNNNLYHSDLLALSNTQPNALKAGDLVEYRIILDNDRSHSDRIFNMGFYYEQDSNKKGIDIRGIAVGSANSLDFDCSYPSKYEPSPSGKGGRDIAEFFVKFKGDPTTKFDSFNILLVPKTGSSTATPVIIDPKILNNG